MKFLKSASKKKLNSFIEKHQQDVMDDLLNEDNRRELLGRIAEQWPHFAVDKRKDKKGSNAISEDQLWALMCQIGVGDKVEISRFGRTVIKDYLTRLNALGRDYQPISKRPETFRRQSSVSLSSASVTPRTDRRVSIFHDDDCQPQVSSQDGHVPN